MPARKEHSNRIYLTVEERHAVQQRVLELLETGPASAFELHRAITDDGIRVQRSIGSFASNVLASLWELGRIERIGHHASNSQLSMWRLPEEEEEEELPSILPPENGVVKEAMPTVIAANFSHPVPPSGYAVRMLDPDTVEVIMTVDLYLEILPTLRGKR